MVKKRAPYKTWTRSEDDTLVMMKNNGKSNAAIAEALGVPVTKVTARMGFLRKKGRQIAKGKAGNPSWKKGQRVSSKKPLAFEKKVTPKSGLREGAKVAATHAAIQELIKLEAYISLLESRNASLQQRLNEIQKVLKD